VASALVILEVVKARIDPPELVATLAVAGGAVVFATALLTLKVREGKNWARWAYLAIAVLSLVSIADAPPELEALAVGRALSVSSALLFVASATLLLTPTASRWFQRG